MFNGGEICWNSSKQCNMAYFTTEAEYFAANDAVKEAVCLKNFIIDLGVVRISGPNLKSFVISYVMWRKPRNLEIIISPSTYFESITFDPRNWIEVMFKFSTFLQMTTQQILSQMCCLKPSLISMLSS